MDKGDVLDPALTRIEAELASPDFRAGVQEGKWCLVDFKFPILKIDINGTKPDGTRALYRIWFEVRGFPGQRVWAQQWSRINDCAATPAERPTGNERVENAFRGWESGGGIHLYCPWEREVAATHPNFLTEFPEKSWNNNRNLIFILEELYGLLNLNNFPGSPR